MLNAGRIALNYSDYVLSIHYFSQIINAKPHLYEPWYLRSVAKYSLDDYIGAAVDCEKAIELNPYVVDMYHLHGICALKQKDYDQAIKDYDKAIEIQNNNKAFWYNRTLCYLEKKEYAKVHEYADSITRRWEKSADVHLLDAEAYLNDKDTVNGEKCIRKSLEIDEHNGKAWEFLGLINSGLKNWRIAESDFTKSIHYRPNYAKNYLYRALSRVNINNLRGAMSDYDKTLEIDPNNVLAHYNRAILRMQVGDDNRAIHDFDFIVNYDPRNVMARFCRAELLENSGNIKKAIRDYDAIIKELPEAWNVRLKRASLCEKVGDFNAAIADYTVILEEFPGSWAVRMERAKLYKKIGQSNKAALDEFKIANEQNDKHFGINTQQHWSKAKLTEVRKRSEIDFSKYKLLIVEDSVEVEHDEVLEEFTGLRGKIQNRNVEEHFLDQVLISDEEAAADSLLQNPIVNYNNGCVEANEMCYDEAILLFTKAIELDPFFDRAYFNRGLALIKKGRKEEAVKDFSKAGELGISHAYSLLKKYTK